jgi:hypothetical protein
MCSTTEPAVLHTSWNNPQPTWLVNTSHKYFGPSKVKALPLGVAAERSVCYHFSFLFSGLHTFFKEGVSDGSDLWHMALSHKNKI